MFERCIIHSIFNFTHAAVDRLQINLLLAHCGADIAGNVQVVAFHGDSFHRDALGIVALFLPELIGIDDLGDVRFGEAVLAFAFLEVFGGVDEEHVVRLLALLEHEDADGDAGGVEEVGGQADDGVDMAVLEQLGADAFFGTATEEHAVGQDDGHHGFVLPSKVFIQGT